MSRNQSLDVLRGVAIVLVLGRHYNYPGIWYGVGWSGVDLFFVLSGFLISGLLFSEYQETGSINLGRFWIRRAFKIYPAFYAMILFVIILCFNAGTLTRHIFSDLFFVQDYIPPMAEHGWSIAVEEKFYFALPVILWIAKRFKKSFHFIPWLFVGLFAGCLVFRTYTLLHFASWNAVAYPAHLRIDSLFAGVTLGYFRYFRESEFRSAGRFWLWVPGLALFVPVLFWDRDNPWMMTIGFSMLSVGYALILLWIVNWTLPNWKFFRGIAWIGQYSYSIYLWHEILKAGLNYEAHRTLFLLPVYIGACIGIGWLAAYLVETPFLKLRDKFYPARSAALRSVQDLPSPPGAFSPGVARQETNGLSP